MRLCAACRVYLALPLAFMSNALPSSFSFSISHTHSATNSSLHASSFAPQSSFVSTVSTEVSSGTSTSSSGGPSSSQWLQSSARGTNSLNLSSTTNGLTIASSAPFIAVTSSSASSPQWSPPVLHAASNGSSNSSGFPSIHIDQKGKDVPGVTASASYSAWGTASSANPASITSVRNLLNATKQVNQTNVCGGPISVASSLITSGLFPANDCLPLNWDQGVLNMPYGGNCSMSPGFDGYNAKSCSCANSAAKWYHDYATATVTSQQCQSSYDKYEALDIQTLGCSYNTITELATPYPAPTSCCDKCEVAASAVQLVFWPPADAPSNPSSGTNNTDSGKWNVTAAPVKSAASYGFVEDGYTFVSPSVYIIYSSVKASASCVALFNSHIPIGSAHTAVTRAYEPQGLSTAICEAQNMGAGIEYCINPVNDPNNPAYCFQGIDNGWRKINFSELYDPPPASDLLTRYQSCFPGHSISADFASMMFVKPQLAFPPDVTDIDPVWATWGGSTCTPVNLGVFDPPRLLQKATALAPVPTPAADPQAQKAPPSPAATLKSPVAAPTRTVTGADPNNNVKANDPGSNNAETATPTTAQPQSGAAVMDPVDSSVVAQNGGRPATGNNNAAKAGSSSESNSDPSSGNSHSESVASEGGKLPVDTEKQSGMNAAANSGHESGTDSGTGKNDLSTGPITLLPQQPAETAKEKSATGDKTGVTTDGTTVGSDEGTAGGANEGSSNDSKAGTSGGTGEGANGSINDSSSKNSNGGKTGGTAGGAHEGSSNGSNAGTSGGTGEGANGSINDSSSKNSNGGKPGGTDGGTGGGTEGGTSGTSQGTDEGSNDGANHGTSGGPNGDGNANPAPVASVNSQPITKDTSGNILLSGSTLAPGGTAIFSGHTIANVPSAVLMDGSTYAPSPTDASASPLLVNNRLVQMTNGELKIASQTLIPGTHTTINNHVIDYANPSRIIEDGVTHNLAPVSSSNPLILDAQTLLRAPNGGLITAGTTIAPGHAAAIDGHVYSLAGSSTVVMDGSTYALPAATNAYQIQPAPPAPGSPQTYNLPDASSSLSVFALQGHLFTARPTAFGQAGESVLPDATGVAVGVDGVMRAGGTTVTLGAGASTSASAGVGGAVGDGGGRGVVDGIGNGTEVVGGIGNGTGVVYRGGAGRMGLGLGLVVGIGIGVGVAGFTL